LLFVQIFGFSTHDQHQIFRPINWISLVFRKLTNIYTKQLFGILLYLIFRKLPNIWIKQLFGILLYLGFRKLPNI
jgi:hypothetical protein